MNILIKYDISHLCKVVLQDELQKLDIDYTIVGLNEI